MATKVLSELARMEELPRTPADPATDLLFEIADVGCAGCVTAIPREVDRRYRDMSNLPLGLGPFGSSISTTRDDVLAELEDRYLTPRPFFSEKWLNRLQSTVERDPDYLSLLALEPSKRRSVIDVVRSGVEGEVTGYREEPLAEFSMTAKNSTSMHREPGSRADFVRGRSGFYPFAPGGLESVVLVPEEDSVEAVAREIEQSLNFDDEGLLTIPPGFERGLLSHDDMDKHHKPQGGSREAEVLNIRSILSEEGAFDFKSEIEETEEAKEEEGEAELDADQMRTPIMEAKEFDNPSIPVPDRPDVDALLPEIPLSLAATPPKRKPVGTTVKRDWAHVVDVNEDFPDFHELVPDMAHEYPFELDIFQKRAVYHLEKGESVFVAAHTSAGKTVVAEYAIALAQRHMTRAIYTSPIKALSNQKFRDFRTTFEDVGILTGDVQIRPEASCLIMTTEILRSMLYRGADLIRDVEFVIFDEVHYVNDTERGVVWEEVIIMLPAHVSLILLSATVPNTKEFADWVGRTKQKNIYVISTPKRPVPLEHYLFAGNEIHKIVDARKKFLSVGWKNANDAYSNSQKKETTSAATGGRGGRGGSRGGGRGFSRGGGAAGSNRVSTVPSGGKNGGRAFSTDRNQWINVITLLKKKNLLPVVIFTFSKRKCEDYAGGLNNIDLSTSSEKSEVHVFIEKSLMRLIGTDRELPQVLRMRDLLSRGIAVHHGGLLPIIKEMVEILFARGLVKVLFATETFAMGVNMPARTCVFSGTKKHDGRSFRDLLPGEYTQMSGRAGRRGLDDTGVVIIAFQDRDGIPEVSALNAMILGTPTKLESQFRLTYNMILNLLRVEALRVEEMIKRSFSENTSQRALPEKQKLFAESEKSLNMMQKLNCGICIEDIERFYDCSARVLDLARKMHEKVLVSHLAPRTLNQGRIVVINNQFYRNSAAVILKPVAGSKSPGIVRGGGGGERLLDDKLFWCMILCDKKTAPDAVDGLAPLPVTHINVPDSTTCTHEITSFSVADMAIITRTSIKIDSEAILDRKGEYEVSGVVRQLRKFAANSRSAGILENDWAKFKELDFQEMCKEKQALMESLTQYQCTKCPDLTEHYALVHEERIVRGKIAELQHIISDQNLELLPDYHQRVEVLKLLNYIDANSTVQLKGRVAAEISTADELILTELILENTLAEFEPSEIVALLSCFVCQERNASEPSLTPRLLKGKKIILDIAARVADVQASSGLPVRVDDYKDSLKFGLVEVVYEWAQGMPFKGITGLTDVLEGSIVRCIVRLDETCREVRSAARMIGDAALYKKMEEAQLAIKRDIVFAASLYFN